MSHLKYDMICFNYILFQISRFEKYIQTWVHSETALNRLEPFLSSILEIALNRSEPFRSIYGIFEFINRSKSL